jgi:hypothetical protein
MRCPLLVTSEQCGYVLRSIVEYYFLYVSLRTKVRTVCIQYKNSWLVVVDGKMDVEKGGRVLANGRKESVGAGGKRAYQQKDN